MAVYTRTLTLPHTADNLFDLVSGIRQYPDFIKWIRSMDVREEASLSAHQLHLIGDARIGFKGFSERFVTRVEADKTARSIDVSLIKGPFKHLTNRWTFVPLDTGTRIEFFIDYEFRNFILRALAAANFDLAVSRIMEAFTSEADRRYQRTDVIA